MVLPNTISVKVGPDVVAWARTFYNNNKEVMRLLDINSPEELLERLLRIPKH